MKRSASDSKLTGLWAVQQFNRFGFRARKVSGPFEKRAPGELHPLSLFFITHDITCGILVGV